MGTRHWRVLSVTRVCSSWHHHLSNRLQPDLAKLSVGDSEPARTTRVHGCDQRQPCQRWFQPAANYSSWASGYSLDPLTNGAADADPDYDGISNGIEFVTGGDPTVCDLENLPTASNVGTNLEFVYRRTDASVYANPVVQTSTTLASGSWSDVTSGIVVEPNYYATGVARVTVTIPHGLATRLFARLLVNVP